MQQEIEQIKSGRLSLNWVFEIHATMASRIFTLTLNWIDSSVHMLQDYFCAEILFTGERLHA